MPHIQMQENRAVKYNTKYYTMNVFSMKEVWCVYLCEMHYKLFWNELKMFVCIVQIYFFFKQGVIFQIYFQG